MGHLFLPGFRALTDRMGTGSGNGYRLSGFSGQRHEYRPYRQLSQHSIFEPSSLHELGWLHIIPQQTCRLGGHSDMDVTCFTTKTLEVAKEIAVNVRELKEKGNTVVDIKTTAFGYNLQDVLVIILHEKAQ